MMKLPPVLASRWHQLSPREKIALHSAVLVTGIFLLWQVVLVPALNTARHAQEQHRLLDAQLQQMRQMQARVRSLQARPRVSREAMIRTLEQSIPALGSGAQLGVADDQATVSLRQIAPGSLSQWLVQLRTQARLQPSEVRLARTSAGSSSAWEGSLTFRLPPIANP